MIVALKKLDPVICQIIAEEDKVKIAKENGATVTMWPTLLDTHTYEDGEEIEQHLEAHFPEHSLKSNDEAVKELTENNSPVSDFNKWLRAESPGDAVHAEKLAKFLNKADQILEQNAKKGDFLDGNSLTLPDCILLPKLHHMREVGKIITVDQGDILKGFTNVERYMKKAENGTAFQTTKREIDDRKWIGFKSKTKKSSDIYNALKSRK